MRVEIRIGQSARSALVRFQKDDPSGTEQVIDSINLLRRNPQQGTPWGEYRRMQVGLYRVMFQVVDGDPVVVSIEHVGRRG